MTNEEIALKIMEIMGAAYIIDYCNKHQCSVVDALLTMVSDIRKFKLFIENEEIGLIRKFIRRIKCKLKDIDTK